MKTIEEISREAAEQMNAKFGFPLLDDEQFSSVSDIIADALREHEKELQADKARLDWLETQTYHGEKSQSKWGNGLAVHQVRGICTKPGLNLREAIDTAMKGAK